MSSADQGPIQVTVNEAADICRATIYQNIENAAAGLPWKRNDVIYLSSSPGMAKTALVEQAHKAVAQDEDFVEWAAKAISETWNLPMDPVLYYETVTTATMEAEDFGGLPWPNEDGETMGRRRFSWVLPRDGMHVLLFDELTKASESVHNVMGQFVYEGRVAEHHVSPGVTAFITGNERKDRSGDKELPRFLTNRTCNLDIVLTMDQWLGWAMKNGIHPLLLAFFKSGANPHFFSAFDPAYKSNPTARTWEKISDKMHSDRFRGEVLLNMINGYVGPAAGAAFATFVQIADELIPAEDVLKDPENAPIPDRPAAQWVLLSSLATAVDKNTMEALSRYLERFEKASPNGREISVFALTLLSEREENKSSSRSSVFFTEAGRKMIEKYSELVLS